MIFDGFSKCDITVFGTKADTAAIMMFLWTAACLVLLLSGYSDGLKILTIGDFGDDGENGRIRQERLAQTMSDFCVENSCDCIISTADNFYNDGVTSVDDVRFNDSWRWVYNKTGISDLDWYMSLGNHDYGTGIAILEDRELHQVEFSLIEPRWILPWLWYDFYLYGDDFSVHFIVVDAMSILLRKYDWEDELEWYEETLAASKGDWKVIVEHYPPYTAGNYATGSIIHRNYLVPPAEEHGADLFIAGHDHNLQHIVKREDQDVDYIVSGGGGRGLYAFDAPRNQTLWQMGFHVKYFGYHNGFVWLDFSREAVTADYIDVNGEKLYSFTRHK